MVVLVGTKADLGAVRQISPERAAEKAKEFDAEIYRETSAKDGTHIDSLFHDIGCRLYAHHGGLRHPPGTPDTTGPPHRTPQDGGIALLGSLRDSACSHRCDGCA